MAVVVRSTTPLKDVIESTTVQSDAMKININHIPAQRETESHVQVEGLVSISRAYEQVLGVITMEDVLEELLQVIK